MNAVMEAHLRMMSTLPVRTHEQRIDHYHGATRGERHETRRDLIRQLVAKGIPKRRLPEILGISWTAVKHHLQAIKRGK